VTAVSRSEDALDIFIIDENTVRTASWEKSEVWGDWKWLLTGG
jgi:hypothetical protein